MQLQVSEGTAVRKLEDANKKIVRLEAQLLQREHKMDEKDQTIYHNRLEARSKAKYLKHTIQVNTVFSKVIEKIQSIYSIGPEHLFYLFFDRNCLFIGRFRLRSH